MGLRIRQLEDALSVIQSTISSEPHPLLRDDLLMVKYSLAKARISEKEEPRDERAETIDAPGILTIGDQGAKYFGPSAGAEVCSSIINEISLIIYLPRRCSWYDFTLARTNELDRCFYPGWCRNGHVRLGT
jgi:hypothetical protein